MDDRRFDSLVKSLAAGASRRTVLKGMLGLGGSAVVAGALIEDDVDAARRPVPTPKPVSCPGQQTWNGSICSCQAPPALGPQKCGPDCCNPAGTGADHSECCDNACCFGTCYGEELCCPTNPGAGGQPPTHKVCGGACIDVGEVDGCCDDSDCGDPCLVCNSLTHICQPRCGAGQVCCTEEAGPGVCVTGTCCPGEPCAGSGLRCCGDTGSPTACIPADCCSDADCPAINACTTNTCVDRFCVQAPVDCDDGNACTIDSCDSVAGCQHEPVACNDDDICSTAICDPKLGCVSTPVDCDDGNACTIDRCDPQRGCVYESVNCDDGDACTFDYCDAARGCIHQPIDCSDHDDPSQCLVGVCRDGQCTTQSTCEGGTSCNGQGVCERPV